MESELLEGTDSGDLEVHVVWSPQLGAGERHVPGAARLIPGPGVRHWWDGDAVMGRRYADVLGTDEPAWDVWLLFARDARWGDPDGAPRPDWWEHQLGSLPDSLHLDAERFARKAAELLEEGG